MRAIRKICALLCCVLVFSAGAAGTTALAAKGEVTCGCPIGTVGAFEKGSGTEKDPFEIRTPEQLRHIEQHSDKCFSLKNDLDLGGQDWQPLCAEEGFSGQLAGNRNDITGLSVTGHELAGLFAVLEETAYIYRLDIKGTVKADEATVAMGGAAGKAAGRLQQVACDLTMIIPQDAPEQLAAGGVVGIGLCEIRQCGFKGTIQDDRANSGSCVGAMMGRFEGTPTEGLPQMITAHSGFAALGGSDDKSEDNTMDNIIKAVNYYPDAIEVDVQSYDSDGDGVRELWLGHDGVDAEKNPPVKEVLELLMGNHERSGELGDHGARVRIQLDTKEDGILDECLALIEEVGFPWERIILAGNNSYEHVTENVEAIRRCVEQGMDFWMNPDYILSYEAMDDDMDAFIDRIRALDLPTFTVNSNYKKLSRPAMDRLHEEGIRVSLWTLNSTKDMPVQMQRGAYNVTSRKVDVLKLRSEMASGTVDNRFDRSLPEIGIYLAAGEPQPSTQEESSPLIYVIPAAVVVLALAAILLVIRRKKRRAS